ncbi:MULTISPECIES: hypothetical protein [unclassified Rickettsia]
MSFLAAAGVVAWLPESSLRGGIYADAAIQAFFVMLNKFCASF